MLWRFSNRLQVRGYKFLKTIICHNLFFINIAEKGKGLAGAMSSSEEDTLSKTNDLPAELHSETTGKADSPPLELTKSKKSKKSKAFYRRESLKKINKMQSPKALELESPLPSPNGTRSSDPHGEAAEQYEHNTTALLSEGSSNMIDVDGVVRSQTLQFNFPQASPGFTRETDDVTDQWQKYQERKFIDNRICMSVVVLA